MAYYIISFDLESTGLSTYTDQVVEFGAAIVRWDSVTGEMQALESFARYAKPTEAKMGRRAEELTGIRPEDLKGAAPIKAVLDLFRDHLEATCEEPIPRLLLSYNGFAYDIPMLVAEILRYGGSPATYFRLLRMESTIDVLPFGRSCFDTSRLVRRANGTCSYRLGDVYQAFCKCPLDGAHGAMADSLAVLDILRAEEVMAPFKAAVEQCSEMPDCAYRRNPMALVRTIMARIESRSSAGRKAGSKRVLDMVGTHLSKKAKTETVCAAVAQKKESRAVE